MRIGIDLGGSHIGIGLVDGDKIVDIREMNFTRQDRLDIENTIVDGIHRLMNELLAGNDLKLEEIESVGIASPGTISHGVIVKAGNLSIRNFNLVERLK